MEFAHFAWESKFAHIFLSFLVYVEIKSWVDAENDLYI